MMSKITKNKIFLFNNQNNRLIIKIKSKNKNKNSLKRNKKTRQWHEKYLKLILFNFLMNYLSICISK